MPRGSCGGAGKKRVPRDRTRERKRITEGERRNRGTKSGHQGEHETQWKKKRHCSTAVPTYNALFLAFVDKIEPRAGSTFSCPDPLSPVPLMSPDLCLQDGFCVGEDWWRLGLFWVWRTTNDWGVTYIRGVCWLVLVFFFLGRRWR